MHAFGSLLVAVLAAGTLFELPAQAMTLDEALASAIQHNADLKVATAHSDMADAQLKQSRAGQFPSITAGGEIGSAKTDLGGFFGFGEQTTSPRAAQITIEQPLLALGVLANVDRAKAGQEAAKKLAIAARLSLATTVAEAYTAVLAAKQRQEAHAVAQKQMDALEREANLQFDRGGLSRTELSRAKSRSAEVRANVARAEGELVRATTHFATVIGAPPTDLVSIDSFPELPATLDQAKALAAANSPALGVAKARLEAADAAVRSAKADMLPTISAVAEAGTVRDLFFPGYRTNDLRIGVRGRMNIFSGGLTTGKIAEAEANRRAAAAELEGAKSLLDEEISTGWQNVISAATMKEATLVASQAATLAFRDAQAEHRLGARAIAELLDAQREQLQADVQRITAEGAYVAAVYRLRSVVGTE